LLYLRRVLFGLGLVASLGLRGFGQAPPVGDWDFVLGGSEHGVAHITFSAEGELSGLVAMTFFGNGAPRTNGAAVIRPVFGAATIEGAWVYESSNRIAGVINEISGAGTNFFTNGLSFRAVVKPTRMQLSAFGSQGRVSFRGVPLLATNDFTGTFQGSGRMPRVSYPFIEVLELAAVSPNNYDVTGRGAGYNSSGTCLVSSQKYAALFQSRGGTNPAVSVYVGPVNFRTGRGSFRGTDGTSTGIHYRMIPAVP
jgi:hypothetical protein